MSSPVLSYLKQTEMELGPCARADFDGDAHRTDWRLERDENDVAWLFFNLRERPVNVLTSTALEGLAQVLDRLEEKLPRALVLRSAKTTGFCVGADINEFRGADSREEIVEQLERAHAVADRLAALSCPTVAVVHGPCLGGGLELALCCDYRLGLPDARLGLPEIRLGLHPGLGGTARLTHLIDPIQAMTLMLTGKTLDARRARKYGLIDDQIEERHLRNAIEAILTGKIERHVPGFKERLLTTAPARRIEGRQMRSKSAEKIDLSHYPAPEALIRLWEDFGDDSAAMRKEEIRSFAELLGSDTAQNLIRVFFLHEKLKGEAKNSAETVRHVHVVGAGSMGGDIAGWCAYKGLRVTLHDPDDAAIGRALRQVVKLCERKHLGEAETRKVLDRLIPDRHNHGVGHADLVIEAVPEKPELKEKVYRELEPRMKDGALLATNTSSIPLEELSAKLADPSRFVGLHFFNPVAKMQLVEVVKQEKTARDVLDRAKRFTGQIDRLPVTVASSPGFLVNRVLMPYLLEAIVLLDEGVPAEHIDRCAESFGMPMGPVELADYVGLDICLDVAAMLERRLDQPLPPIPGWFEEQVKDGKLGKKSGEGFYRWKDGEAQKDDDVPDADPALTDRLLLALLNACVTCLRTGVIEDDELLDGAMIFGTGFAPFRGGPLHYARERGVKDIVATLEKLAADGAERFTPDPGWKKFS